MIVKVLFADLSFVKGKLGPPVDGASQTDITLKGIARMAIWTPRVFLPLKQNIDIWTAILRGTILAGAALQSARLFVDMPLGAIYSV